jgi:small ligand-binding sensory domain FIST
MCLCDADASPAAWSELLGVPPDCVDPVSFLVLSDPTFGRVEELMAGLDYAFPEANKIGELQ